VGRYRDSRDCASSWSVVQTPPPATFHPNISSISFPTTHIYDSERSCPIIGFRILQAFLSLLQKDCSRSLRLFVSQSSRPLRNFISPKLASRSIQTAPFHAERSNRRSRVLTDKRRKLLSRRKRVSCLSEMAEIAII
jgi:hypothetical protein